MDRVSLYNRGLTDMEDDSRPDPVELPDVTEEQLSLLIDLSRSINSRQDLKLILRKAVEHAIILSRAERGFLFLSDGTSHLTVKVALDSVGRDILDEPVRISSGVVSAMLAHGIPIFLEDVRLNSEFSGRRSLSEMGVRYVLGIPLKARGHILGFIYVDNSRTSRQFSSGDRKILTSFADQAALAIENAQLRRRSEEADQVASIGRLGELLLGDIDAALVHMARARETLAAGGTDRVAVASADAHIRIAACDLAYRVAEVNDFRDMLADEIDIRLGSVELDQIVAEAIAGVKALVESGRIRVHLSLNTSRSIMLDRDRIRRAVDGILRRSIALIRNQDAPEIAVTTAPAPEGILLEVKTGGPMLTEAETASFFEPFGAGRWIEHAGPGLAVARHVVEKHRGRIQVKSSKVDGTCVWLTLPTDLRPSMIPRAVRASKMPSIPPTVPPHGRSDH